MKQWKRAGAAAAAVVLAAWFPLLQTASADTGKRADGKAVVIARDEGQMARRMNRRWDSSSYYERAEIDAASGTVRVDGEEQELAEFLDLSPEEAGELSEGSGDENQEKILEYLADQEVYTADAADGVVAMTSPYQTCRILLSAPGTVEDTFGADQVTYFEPFDQYVLEYDSEEETKAAAEALREIYGSGNVLVTQVVSAAAVSTGKNAGPAGGWGLSYTGLEGLADAAETDPFAKEPVVVAILDSGIYAGHEMFKGRTISPDSYNFIEGSSDVADDNGHGTHVAGIAAAATSSEVEFLIYKVLDARGKGDSLTLLTATYKAAKSGADVINISAAFPWDSSAFDSEEASEEAFGRYEAVMQTASEQAVICASAGNEYTALENDLALIRYYPAVSAYTLAVSSIDDTETLSKTSCWGEAIDFAAPGEDILSAWPGGKARYLSMSGTSMAAPFVSAAAAMMKLYQPENTPADTAEGLKLYAKDLGDAGKDVFFGYGSIVFPAPESIDISNSGASIYRRIRGAEAFRLQVFSGAKYRFSTDDASVALVSQTGLVRVKNAGNTTVRVTTESSWDYRSGDLTIYRPGELAIDVRVRPKATAIKWIHAGKNRFSIGFVRRISADGYQIKYALKKDMSGEKAFKVSGGDNYKAVIKGLQSGKTYYVRIRTFNYNQGRTWFGAWSSIEKIKVS